MSPESKQNKISLAFLFSSSSFAGAASKLTESATFSDDLRYLGVLKSAAIPSSTCSFFLFETQFFDAVSSSTFQWF
nr:hypothetical protein CFP56_10678 [Quercus suber]